MKNKFFQKSAEFIESYSNNFVSRWVVFVFDVLTITGSYAFANLVWYGFNYVVLDTIVFFKQLIVVTFVYSVLFLINKSYVGILRHTGLSDILKILISAGSSFLLIMGLDIFLSLIGDFDSIIVPISLLIIHFLISIFLLMGFRVAIKIFFNQITSQFKKGEISVLIYGAGTAGLLTKNALLKDKDYKYKIIAFIDDNPSKVRKTIDGVSVISQYVALTHNFIQNNRIKQLIIAIPDIQIEKKKRIVEKGIELQIKVKVVPGINELIDGQLNSKQLRRVNIEDLLERSPIELDNENIKNEIKNNIILVTGGAGSIGSEIVRQVLNYYPKRLIIVDQAESPLYDLQFEINNSPSFKHVHENVIFIVADVRDKFRMKSIFNTYRPSIVYHAAAYKHVPLMEKNPYEAILVNVFGTKNIADLSIKYGVKKFVMVSTDKAVNPTNIMGASKRIAELYIQSLKDEKTKFITTRFGNVLGSNGSVVPLFKKQIEQGGPVTITHKDITRYFMTIPEACNLVLEAGAMGSGTDIFIFDMGEPIKVINIARKMIQLYGYDPDNDIKIVEIGLRPGEKLYEELLNNKENTLPTHHPKIKRARVMDIDKERMNIYLTELSECILDEDEFNLVKKMKEIVPEFISNNSIFEKLDIVE